MQTARRDALRRITGVIVAAAALTIGVSEARTGIAAKRTHVQINRTMALPGVTLAPGHYTFEVLNPETGSHTVLVSSGRPARRAVFLGFARRVERPLGLPANQVITVGEAPAGEPVPITAWYPQGFASGYRFIYE